jgi:hypothetical protein
MKYYVVLMLLCGELLAMDASGLPEITETNEILLKNITITKISPEMREENRHYYKGENNSVFLLTKTLNLKICLKWSRINTRKKYLKHLDRNFY